jgi:hypothetical protein
VRGTIGALESAAEVSEPWDPRPTDAGHRVTFGTRRVFAQAIIEALPRRRSTSGGRVVMHVAPFAQDTHPTAPAELGVASIPNLVSAAMKPHVAVLRGGRRAPQRALRPRRPAGLHLAGGRVLRLEQRRLERLVRQDIAERCRSWARASARPSSSVPRNVVTDGSRSHP